MPFACRIDAARRLGIATLSGAVDGAEFREAMRALYDHPAWRPDFGALWDARRLTALLFQPDDVDAVLALTSSLEGRMGEGRAAFVVPIELHRMIASLIIRRRTGAVRERQVFETIEPALTWLGVGATGDGEEP